MVWSDYIDTRQAWQYWAQTFSSHFSIIINLITIVDTISSRDTLKAELTEGSLPSKSSAYNSHLTMMLCVQVRENYYRGRHWRHFEHRPGTLAKRFWHIRFYSSLSLTYIYVCKCERRHEPIYWNCFAE